MPVRCCITSWMRNSLTEDIAEALYTGIIHDTGVFQYSNTTPETLQAAAFLISFGFNFSEADRGKLLPEDVSADRRSWAEL